MRVVIDTNVFVSMLIRPGDRFLALIEYLDHNATILYSNETLTELVDVLRPGAPTISSRATETCWC